MAEDFPRRACLDRLTPAEHAIYEAVSRVEDAGADVRLTDAVVLLQAARESVADFVDGIDRRRHVVVGQAEPAARIHDRCPSCGNQTLFLGEGGLLTCSWLKCQEPAVGRAVADLQQRLARATRTLGQALAMLQAIELLLGAGADVSVTAAVRETLELFAVNEPAPAQRA